MVHRGGRIVTREELEQVEAPEPTRTWFPVKHAVVVDTVGQALVAAGFTVQRQKFALSRSLDQGGTARMFATMDLAQGLADGVTVSVGIRNSIDKSLPLGFCAGSRVFVCDNLAFRSELMVSRKHTRNGQDRFQEAICLAVKGLVQFQAAERERIAFMKAAEVRDVQAESLILRSFEQGMVSSRLLPEVIREWREPTYAEFEPRTAWSLYNAFTTVLGRGQKTAGQKYAALTMKLGLLFDPAKPEIAQAV